jgi:8-oxo-dGTP pyrophosphatase MutT (NUDIX family)
MKKPKDRVRSEPDREPKTQYAALPWRTTAEGAVEVLMITSRESGRWVIPKGWPIKRFGPHQSAAQEAFEEAGVKGAVKDRALGVYHYDKRLRSGRAQHVRVFVFPLEVKEVVDDWPEKSQRERVWMAPADAGGRVHEPELAQLLKSFP